MEQTIRAKAPDAPGQVSTKSLLVISSYRRPCGIAQYVEAIEPALRSLAIGKFDIAALPVDLIRSQAPFARRAGQKQFQEIIERAKQADVINLQLEPGLLGLTPFDIWSRLKAILDASKRVIITYHTVPTVTAARFGLKPAQLMAYLAGYRGNYVFNRLFEVVRRNPYKFAHIVQTKREKRNFSYSGIPPETIFDQPLSFVTEDRREAMDYEEARSSVRKAYGVSRGRVIGCFGFLTPYKGIEVAINALEHLPKDFSLLVAGGLHPEGIRPHSVQQPYVETLIDAAGKQSGRVHFLGALDDNEFMRVLAACDAVVLPYAEVGQTSSGPASMALDLQKPVYCSRNYCFRELEKYQKDVISLFEIGNYVELAQKIERDEGNTPARVQARKDYLQKYNAETRSALYWHAFKSLLERSN